MADNWKMPILELGEVEAIAPDGTEGICYDSAIIFFKDDEPGELSIDVECPAALRVAAFIVTASNFHVELLEQLKDAALQIEYLQEKVSTSTGVAVLARINDLLSRVGGTTK